MDSFKRGNRLLEWWILPLLTGIFLGFGYSFTKKTIFIINNRETSMVSIFPRKDNFPGLTLEEFKQKMAKVGLEKSTISNYGLKDQNIFNKEKSQKISIDEEFYANIVKTLPPVFNNQGISSESIYLYKKAQVFFQNQNLHKILKTLTEP